MSVTARPHLPVVAFRVAGTGVWAVTGAVITALVVIDADKPLGRLIGVLAWASFYGMAMWWFMRLAGSTRWEELDRVSGPGERGTAASVARGLLAGAAGCAVAVLVLWGLARLDEGSGDGIYVVMMPGLLLGTALWGALELRALRRWQASTGLEVFTKFGGRKWAWTSSQARERLVAAPSSQER